jgi:hypothetical protein
MIDAELLTYSREHLHYEVWMLEETAERLLHTPLHLDRVAKNTAVESFSIHARTLTAFLYPDECQHRESDVAADDYVTDPNDWRRVRGHLPAGLRTVIQRTAKEIAHLTTQRLNYDEPDREWPVALITETLWASLKLFATQASPTRLDAAVRRYIAALESPTTSMKISVYTTTCTGVTTVSGPASLTADNFTQGS